MEHSKKKVRYVHLPHIQAVISEMGNIFDKRRTRPYKTNFMIMSEYDVAEAMENT